MSGRGPGKTGGEPVTELLARARCGSRDAADELLAVIYRELRKLARARMAREKPGRTLQTTALVHEAYLRLLGTAEQEWESRAHFFGAASQAMRRILVEQARRRSRARRGGDRLRVTLDAVDAPRAPDPDEMLALDIALTRLEKRDRAMADVVKLRYFAGLTVDETSAALELHPRKVNRLWTSARAWLRRAMESGEA